jgi:hypothetical protein
VPERSTDGAERMTSWPAVVKRSKRARALASAQPSSLDWTVFRDGRRCLGGGAAMLQQKRVAAMAS